MMRTFGESSASMAAPDADNRRENMARRSVPTNHVSRRGRESSGVRWFIQRMEANHMRSVLGVLSLLIALAIAGVVVNKELAASSRTAVTAPAGSGVVVPAVTGDATPRQQNEQIQQQVKQSVEAAMQQARPVPDDK